MKINDYKELRIWQMGIEIVDKTYLITKQFPISEQYCLSSQMQRSSISIPSNIAEGFARQYPKEYVHFLYISLGSCAELDTQLLISHKRNYILGDAYDGLAKDINYEMKMLSTVIKNFKNH